jgi:hypothetical protein
MIDRTTLLFALPGFRVLNVTPRLRLVDRQPRARVNGAELREVVGPQRLQPHELTGHLDRQVQAPRRRRPAPAVVPGPLHKEPVTVPLSRQAGECSQRGSWRRRRGTSQRSPAGRRRSPGVARRLRCSGAGRTGANHPMQHRRRVSLVGCGVRCRSPRRQRPSGRASQGLFQSAGGSLTEAVRSLWAIGNALGGTGQASVEDAVVAIRGRRWIRPRNSLTLLTRRESASRTTTMLR